MNEANVMPEVLNPVALRTWLVANPDLELKMWNVEKCLFAQFLQANGYPYAQFGISYFWLKEFSNDDDVIPAPDWTREVQHRVFSSDGSQRVLAVLDRLGL